MIRRPPRSTRNCSSAASDVYKRQHRYYLVLLGFIFTRCILQHAVLVRSSSRQKGITISSTCALRLSAILGLLTKQVTLTLPGITCTHAVAAKGKEECCKVCHNGHFTDRCTPGIPAVPIAQRFKQRSETKTQHARRALMVVVVAVSYTHLTLPTSSYV